ncbi:MAG: membrane protein insertase YidC [Desulfovibrio sp.]|uniref:membrane protein insertase YidC n=1 Tax=Desulfovibrio sp. 7SRBS1 TaxID=3378064 RepID=UPI003B3F98CD
MDTKRVILATALSFLVIVVWSYFFTPAQQPAPPKNATQQTSQTVPDKVTSDFPDTKSAEKVSPATFVPTDGKTIAVDTPLYNARINTQGGVLEHFTLKKYKQTIAKDSPLIDLVSTQASSMAPMGVIYNGLPTWNKGQWSYDGQETTSLSGNDASVLRFVCRVAGMHLVRELTFHADSYLIEENLRLQNMSDSQAQARVTFTLASTGMTQHEDRYNHTRIAWLNKDGLTEEKDEDDAKEGLMGDNELQWGGLQSNYFLMALAPETTDAVFKAKLVDNVYRLGVEKTGLLVEPGMESTVLNDYYIGPKEEKYLEGAPNKLSSAVDFGFFDFLAKPLLMGLNWFYSYVGNWGVAIILLTVCIKILFWPLSHKSYKSMNKMKKIQPMMTKVREKYKDDRQKMNEEMMQLYKTYKVNPAGGCVPMLIQIPVFFGLYQALLGSIQLRHAVFIKYLPFTDYIWLADLSAKDPFYITPLIMGATMFLQQKLTPTPGDPTQAKIMLFMPVIFTFMFLNFPSGLVVYWLVNNVLSIGQQWLMLRKA